MANETSPRITILIEKLRSDDDNERSAAQRALFDEYVHSLLGMARSRLGPALLQRGSEPQAIADSALRTFLQNPREGVNNRSALWCFLLQTLKNKCNSEYRFQYAAKRSPKREEQPIDDTKGGTTHLEANAPVRPMERPEKHRHIKLKVDLDSLEREDDDFFDDDLITILMHGVQPDEAAMLIELINNLEPELAKVALLKLEGLSNEEVGKKLGVTAKTIANLLEEIAERWSED